MCGIAGIVRWTGLPVRSGEIEAMTAALAHRGPDGNGHLTRNGVSLGHRRLSIIDLEGGTQPMSTIDGELSVTFNGEIYNFRELRRELEACGHRFNTRSDTEVILHAYAKWGDACVERFRGMFAFGLVDFRQRRVLLARDHLGIKPLYYRIEATGLAFASELSALRQMHAPVPRGNVNAIDLYLRFGYIPSPETIYEGVFKLPPAHRLVIGFNGQMEPPTRYWDLAFRAKEHLPDSEWEMRLKAVLRDSVKSHLIADVPFGVLLSGGIDSTMVAQEMGELMDRPVQAFAIGFEEEQYSELKYAESAAKICGISLHTEVVRPDVVHLLPELLQHYGEPFGDASALPTWHVCKLARSAVPMVLSGDGGDEAFAGYGRYNVWMKHGLTWAIRQLLGQPRDIGAAVKLFTDQALNPKRAARTAWEQQMTYFRARGRQHLWQPAFRTGAIADCQLFVDAATRSNQMDKLAYAQYMDLQTYLPCDILTKVDIASMYHGLEVRTPFVDREVLEFAATLPMHLRRRRTGLRSHSLKPLLKMTLAKTFPEQFVNRPKMGFGLPLTPWWRTGSPVRAMLDQVLFAQGAAMHQLFEPNALRSVVARHDSGHDNQYGLWVLLALGVWLEQNRDVSFEPT